MRKIALALLFLAWASSPQAQTPFYQGKTITIVAPTKAGDLYDLYPRLLAEHMPRYIPGNPNIIVQNMPGAASLIAANHVYNVAKPDGLTLGSFYPALYLDQLAQRPEVKFDWTKWNWMAWRVVTGEVMTTATATRPIAHTAARFMALILSGLSPTPPAGAEW